MKLEQTEGEAMFRKDLIDLLQHHPATLRELSEQLEEPVKDMESDLRHLLKTLRHLPYRAVVTPARCNKCNFVFHKDKLHTVYICYSWNISKVQSVNEGRSGLVVVKSSIKVNTVSKVVWIESASGPRHLSPALSFSSCPLSFR
ncbi:MAG: hypothetical protein PVF13_08685 [Chromatiales bacterium]